MEPSLLSLCIKSENVSFSVVARPTPANEHALNLQVVDAIFSPLRDHSGQVKFDISLLIYERYFSCGFPLQKLR
jgi:hypothetical protein